MRVTVEYSSALLDRLERIAADIKRAHPQHAATLEGLVRGARHVMDAQRQQVKAEAAVFARRLREQLAEQLGSDDAMAQALESLEQAVEGRKEEPDTARAEDRA